MFSKADIFKDQIPIEAFLFAHAGLRLHDSVWVAFDKMATVYMKVLHNEAAQVCDMRRTIQLPQTYSHALL